MEQFLCKTCGQPLVRQGNNYICNYCGNAWVADLANDIHAVQRANAWEALRRGDFEKATELFDEILLKNNNDYEALWGKALSLNAILYVIDLSEDKRVPTCNNITENSFISSNEVKKAISIAPSEVASSYKKQAEYIEKVRLEWLEKASKEPEYDVFISFKDSDRDNGIERTQDSIDAQDLYNLLTAEGLKVFFSRISLRNKISEQYEPYIYNAIKTAKVMIVFGEKVEYFTAPWIKNEWRRYLSRIESGEKHKNSLVVVYKDINVGELPRVLSSKQCLNYEDVTFSLTLVRHIKGIIEDYNKNKKIKRVEIKGGEISKKATSLEVNQIQTRELGANSVQTSINDAQKLSLVDTYLGENMFSEAQKLLNEVLIESPNSGEAIYKSLQIKYKKSPATSVNQADLALLEKAILNSAKENSANILNKLYSLEFEDNITEALLKTILPFEYEGRTSQINLAFEKAIKKHNYKTFCLLLKTLNANEVDRYIDYNMRYVYACKQEENVITCLNNVISVDGGNVDVLDKLYKLQLVYKKDQQKALEIFEELLKYSKNPEQKIKECIQYLNDYFNPSYCGLIKKILSYSSADISEYKKIILNSANKALLGMNFEVAEQLISIITTENEQDPEIYWNICLIKTKSISAENIVNSDIALNSLPEFQKYLLLASEADRKKCLDIVKRQTIAIENRRKVAKETEIVLTAYTLIGKLQKLEKSGAQNNQKRLNELNIELKKLEELKNKWHSIENQINLYRSQIKDGKQEIEERNAKKRKLGIFAIKEKSDLSREIKTIENLINSNENKISNLLTSKGKYISYESVCKDYESVKAEHEALNGLSSAQMRELLNRSSLGQRLLQDYDKFKNIKVGSVVNFGYYPKGFATSKSPIEWQVLDIQGTKALLLTKEGIDCKQYHSANDYTNWSKCSLRKWLNEDFVKTAFLTDKNAVSDKDRILAVNIPTDKNPNFSTDCGNPTQDKVFLLSAREALAYFTSNSTRICKATPYAMQNGATGPNSYWLLRTLGSYGANVCYVGTDGSISYNGYYVNATNRVIRPAIWVELDEVKLASQKLTEIALLRGV